MPHRHCPSRPARPIDPHAHRSPAFRLKLEVIEYLNRLLDFWEEQDSDRDPEGEDHALYRYCDCLTHDTRPTHWSYQEMDFWNETAGKQSGDARQREEMLRKTVKEMAKVVEKELYEACLCDEGVEKSDEEEEKIDDLIDRVGELLRRCNDHPWVF